MAVKPPTELDPQLDPTPTETPAPAGVSASGEEEIEEILVAGVGSRLGARIARPFKTLFNTAGASRQRNLPESLRIDTKRGEKEYFSEDQPAADKIEPGGGPDRVRTDNETLRTPEEIQDKVDELDSVLAGADYQDFDLSESWQINPENFTSPKDFEKAQMAIAKRYRMDIDRQRRGIVTEEETMKLARALSDDPKFIAEFIQNPPGGAANAEQIQAARILVLKSAENLKRSAVNYRRKAVGDDVQVSELEFLRNWNIHKELLGRFMGVRAEAGRALRAISGQSIGPIKDLPRARVEELLASYGSALDPGRMADAIIANPNLLSLNKTVNAQSSGISKWGAFAAENMTGSILSGLSTFGVNPIGNAYMMGRHMANTALAARLGKWTYSGQSEVEVGEAMAFFYGAMSNFRRASQAFTVSLRTAEPYGGSAKFEGARDKAIDARALGFNPNTIHGAAINIYGHIARAPMERILGPTDAFFKVLNESGMWSQLSMRQAIKEQRLNGWTDAETQVRYRELLENPDDETLGRMKDLGEENTFTNPLGPSGKKWQAVVQDTAVGRLLVPVFRTPLQITKVGFLEDTPLGFLSRVTHSKLYPKPEPGKSALTPRQIEDMQMAQSKMVVGTMTTAALVSLAMNGYLTGSGPREQGGREGLRNVVPPRSFPVAFDDAGNPTEWRSFDRLEPLSLHFGLIADFVDAVKISQFVDLDQSQVDMIENLGAALTLAMYENTVNKTYMRGVNEAIDAISDPDRYYERWAATFLNAQLPLAGARRDLRKMMDPGLRQAEGILERLQNSMPYFSKNLPHLVGRHGEYMDYEHLLNLPFKEFEVSEEPVDLEYARLYQSTQIGPVTMPTKRIGGVKLDADLVHDYNKISRDGIRVLFSEDGFMQAVDVSTPLYDENAHWRDRIQPQAGDHYLTFKGAVEKFMQSEEYDAPGMTDYRRVEMIRTIQRTYDEAARRFLKANNSRLAEEIMLKEQNSMRRKFGRERADQEMRNQGIEPITPKSEQPLFNFD